MKQTLIVLMAIMLAGCEAISSLGGNRDEPDISLVEIEKLTENVWLHTSHYEFPGGAKVPSNGIAIRDGDGLILVDTAWGEIATQELVRDLKEATGLSVSKLVITHFHYDRLAGVDWLERQGVTVFTHPETPGLTAALGTPVPDTSVSALTDPRSRTAIGPVEVAYPGPAHTVDNLVVYVKDDRVLFGGCAVRAAQNKTMGNVADADLSAWGPSIAWTKAVYKDAQIVVPSHGSPGNAKLLDHTLALIARTVNATDAQPAEPAPEP